MSSLQMQMLVKTMKEMMQQQGMPQYGADIDPVVLRRTMEESQKRMPIHPGVTIKTDNLGGVPAEKLIPENGCNNAIIVYIHGGGYVCGNAECSRGYGSLLSAELKMTVYTLSYRLAPENKFPSITDDCLTAYRALVERYPDPPIVLLGESAGAHLSVVTSLLAKDAGMKLPACVVAYSAPGDLTGAVDRSPFVETDIMVNGNLEKWMADMYFLGIDPKRQEISPVYGDFEGFPPIKIVCDSKETLSPDSKLLADKATAAGVEVEYKVYDDCFHAFPTTGRGTPESTEVLEETIAFIKRHISVI